MNKFEANFTTIFIFLFSLCFGDLKAYAAYDYYGGQLFLQFCPLANLNNESNHKERL